MTRIKYSRTENEHGFWLHTGWLPAGPNLLLSAMIAEGDELNTCSFSIYSKGTGTIMYIQNIPTIRSAKSQVRNKLIELGLKLDDEIRRTTPKSGND